VSFTASSPSHLKAMLSHAEPTFKRLSAIKHWFIGADVLDYALVNKIQRLQPDLKIHYFYGSTETTSDVTCFSVPANYQGGAFSTPIGRPLANTRFYILDENLNPVPVGGVGEVYVEGDQLSRGYDRAPRLTAEKFIPNPYSDKMGARLYCMGDLARLMPNGDVVVVGRRDNQVNINGFRVEFSEVEHALLSLDEVENAVASIYEENGIRYLLAYIVPRGEYREKIIREMIAQILPEYTLPHVLLPIDKMPLNELGKINRRLLPAPCNLITLILEANYTAPRNEVELALQEVWQSVLARNGVVDRRIGVHDHFFQVGGNSLLSTQLINAIRNEIGMEFPIKDFFEKPTIAQQAERILQEIFEMEAEPNE